MNATLDYMYYLRLRVLIVSVLRFLARRRAYVRFELHSGKLGYKSFVRWCCINGKSFFSRKVLDKPLRVIVT